NNVEVLVCAEYDHGIYWQVFDGVDDLVVSTISVPCFTLEAEQKAYVGLGMQEKAEFLELVYNL
ncbi:hypothetical protein KAH94_04525, partial [bacterium]|nr:hypothetical protein [bacterium]